MKFIQFVYDDFNGSIFEFAVFTNEEAYDNYMNAFQKVCYRIYNGEEFYFYYNSFNNEDYIIFDNEREFRKCFTVKEITESELEVLGKFVWPVTYSAMKTTLCAYFTEAFPLEDIYDFGVFFNDEPTD